QDGMSCTSCPDAIAKVVMKVDSHIRSGGALTANAIEPTPLLKNGRDKRPVMPPDGPGQEFADSATSTGQERVASLVQERAAGPSQYGYYSANPSYLDSEDTPERELQAKMAARMDAEDTTFDYLDLPGQYQAFCPECSSEVEHEGGCVICRNCGYSKCS
ncbi:MAG: hypothetical protein FWF30_04700, partial [Coriobacteriia bacterium]|nr:hypothetical protein [Coriobacteriia bacterium]